MYEELEVAANVQAVVGGGRARVPERAGTGGVDAVLVWFAFVKGLGVIVVVELVAGPL